MDRNYKLNERNSLRVASLDQTNIVKPGQQSHSALLSKSKNIVDSDLSSDGNEIADEVRIPMEAAFGTDFSQVRIHEGAQAESAGALAYTQGNDIYFSPGEYEQNSQKGKELLGHELAHVIQQKKGILATGNINGLSVNEDDSLEKEADEMGAQSARGEKIHSLSHGVKQLTTSKNVIQRRPVIPAHNRELSPLLEFLDHHRDHGFSAIETFARAFARYDISTILQATETVQLMLSIPGHQFGNFTKGFESQGFRSEVDDGSQSQIGHFLTALSLGYRPESLAENIAAGTSVAGVLAPGRTDYRSIAEQLVVGHEFSGDPRGGIGQAPSPTDLAIGTVIETVDIDIRLILSAAIMAHAQQFISGILNNRVGVFDAAVLYVKSLGPEGVVDFEHLDEILAPISADLLSIPMRDTRENGIRAGNTIQDLRNSVMGFALGELVRDNNEFAEGNTFYRWIQRNVATRHSTP